ncbi:hypothetical protein NG2371_01385 [Nocardia gamkensis]|nr:hypothetical protein [Nocardia gamkensis]
MNIRIASAILVLLTLAVAVGLFALPAGTPYPAPENAVYVRAGSAAPNSGVGTCALVMSFLICGAATIGVAFFGPGAPKGSRSSGTLSTGQLVSSLVERAGRGLAHLHQELEVVLGLLQTVDQQIDRLVRVQAGQYAAQLVQHRRLVGVEQ